MVEFALLIPVLLALIMGTIEFSRLFAIQTLVDAASREAARYGAGGGDKGFGTQNQYQDCTGIEAAAKRVAGALIELSSVTISYDNGPGTSQISPPGCPPPSDQIGLATRVVVGVTANYEPVVPLVPLPSRTIISETARSLLIDIKPDE